MKRRRIPDAGEASSTKMKHSADTKEESRFVLLGGEKLLKAEECNSILRIGQSQQVLDLEDWEVLTKMKQQRITDEDVPLNRPATEEPKSDLRLVLLGGDCAYNCYASNMILRTVHTECAINPKKGNIREGTVDGRQVSVFVTPSYWMNHLASYMFFRNGVESIRHEIQNCTTVTFPGPHAFLLVMRPGHTTGKEHHLLKAITYMFGAEALQYTMVLFVHGHEWENPEEHLKNCCMKMCGARHFILENSNENIKELFKQINAMTRMKSNSFFVQKSYENVMKMCFEPWERAQVSKEAKLQKELEETKTEQCLREDMKAEFDSPRIERDLRKKLEASRHYENVLQKDLDTAMCNERQLRNELKASRDHESMLRKELDTAMSIERQLRNELKASRHYESVLQKDLDTAMSTEIQLKNELKASRDSESALQKDLATAMSNERQSRNELKATRDNESVLQKDLDTAMCNERQLRNELKASKDYESVLQKELDRVKQSEIHLRKEMEDVLKISKAGVLKSVRRSSIDGLPPIMKEDQSNKPLDDMEEI
ncbi:GTPase IMAP family member 2-like, partial [Clarias magur]